MIVLIVLATWVGLAVVCAPLVGMVLRHGSRVTAMPVTGLGLPGVPLPARVPTAQVADEADEPRRRSTDGRPQVRVVA